MKRFLVSLMCVLLLCVMVMPSATFAATDFEGVPDNDEGYVPDTNPDKPSEQEPPEYNQGGFVTGILIKLVATFIDALAGIFNWAVTNTSLESVIFGSANPLNGQEFSSSSVGHVFSAAEWNYAVNPLRIAFASVGWILFVAIIAFYGIKLMKESTNPLQRTELAENIYGLIGGAAMLVFMYLAVFIIFNLNFAIVSGLQDLIHDTKTFDKIFGVFQSWDDKSITGSNIGDSIVHLGVTSMTFVILIQYIFRKFIIAFLVVISPLAAVAYARDKNGQAFKTWFSELLSQTFIQSAHAIVIVLYLAFVNASTNGESILDMDSLSTLGNSVQSIVDPVLSFLIAIGGVIAVGALTYNGLRLSISGGNPKTRVGAIKGIRTSLIGCLICIGSVLIVNVLRGFMF